MRYRQPSLPDMPGELPLQAAFERAARRRRRRIRLLAWVVVLSTVATIVVSVMR